MITIEMAFEIRAEIKELGRAEKGVVEQILYGTYDKYKDEAQDIANEDVDAQSK